MRIPAPSKVRVASIFDLSTPLTDERFPYHEYIFNDKKNFFAKRLKKMKLKPEFPTAKYVSIVKYFEGDKYIVRGTNRRTKCYSVGILTTDNYFYFNRFRTVQNALTRKSIPLLYNVFLRGYNYNIGTSVVFSKNIHNLHDPVELLFSVITGVTGVRDYRVDLFRKCALVNATYGCCKGARDTISGFKRSYMKECVGKLHEMGAFRFADGNEFIEKMFNKYLKKGGVVRDTNGVIECLVGLLFLQCKDIHTRSPEMKNLIKTAQRGNVLEQEEMERTLSEKIESGGSI